MKFTESVSYPMDLDALEAMSLDPRFVRSRFARFIDDLEVSVEGRTVRASGPIESSLIPQAAKAVVRGEVRVELVETWSGEGAARTARTTLEAKGAPVRLRIESTFSGGSETTRKAAGDLAVSIPFFGSRIEKEAVERAGLVLREETRLAADYATVHGA